jgi:hypothetical protein
MCMFSEQLMLKPLTGNSVPMCLNMLGNKGPFLLYLVQDDVLSLNYGTIVLSLTKLQHQICH